MAKEEREEGLGANMQLTGCLAYSWLTVGRCSREREGKNEGEEARKEGKKERKKEKSRVKKKEKEKALFNYIITSNSGFCLYVEHICLAVDRNGR